jgi:hypothetical protein
MHARPSGHYQNEITTVTLFPPADPVESNFVGGSADSTGQAQVVNWTGKSCFIKPTPEGAGYYEVEMLFFSIAWAFTPRSMACPTNTLALQGVTKGGQTP